jgi:hypothetical protein
VTVFFRVAGPLAWPDARENGMTVTAAREMSSGQRVGPGEVPPDGLRLRLQPDRSGRGPLDGGWWPRSADPAAELRGLILALDKRHDRVARVMLGTAAGNLEQAPAFLAAVGPGSS